MLEYFVALALRIISVLAKFDYVYTETLLLPFSLSDLATVGVFLLVQITLLPHQAHSKLLQDDR